MKIHPLLRVLATNPELLADHAAAYGALLEEEATKVVGSLALKIAMFAGAAFLMILALFFTGVALMLRGALPPSSYPDGWALWAVPLGTLLLAMVLGLVARARPIEKPLAVIRAQLQSDIELLREASGETAGVRP